MKRALPIALCFIFGIAALITSIVNTDQVASISSGLYAAWQIIFACGLIVGVISVIFVTGKKIARGDDRFFNAVMLFGICVMPLAAAFGGRKGGSAYLWIFENVQAPMQATVFALLAFYVASAAFRGMRARNAPSLVLLLTALLVILGRVPLIDSHVPIAADIITWLRKFPSEAAKAALLVGVGLASVTTSLRVILGVERPYLGGR